ncbi:MAG: hypothetical protein FWC16_09430 [Defluviitaleaceae bacterium]|nr:hypothetical protein [Defluviitaleaceae bacterium]MCL2275133.1 hypothetical protein [Defluviitaleaceae bacterium]
MKHLCIKAIALLCFAVLLLPLTAHAVSVGDLPDNFTPLDIFEQQFGGEVGERAQEMFEDMMRIPERERAYWAQVRSARRAAVSLLLLYILLLGNAWRKQHGLRKVVLTTPGRVSFEAFEGSDLTQAEEREKNHKWSTDDTLFIIFLVLSSGGLYFVLYSILYRFMVTPL